MIVLLALLGQIALSILALVILLAIDKNKREEARKNWRNKK